MSNIIPIVSSSPPPIEDSQSFGWGDDDDDDFGNFASAPNVGFAENDVGESGTPGFDVNWSHAESSVFQAGSKDLSPPPITERDTPSPNQEPARNESAVEENGNGSPYMPGSAGSSSPSKSDSVPAEGSGATESDAGLGADNDLNEDDDFADFAAFQDESNNKLSKPQLGSLPLQNPDHLEEGAVVQDHDDSTEKTVEPAMEKSRESTTTDSGVFSTDISPLPKSDSFSEGDRVVQSEDETSTELPQDTHQESSSPAVAGHSTSESDAQKTQENFSVSFDSRSDTPQNEDTGDKIDGYSSKGEDQAEHFENEENPMQKESGPGEQEKISVAEQREETDAPATMLETDTIERAADSEVEGSNNKEIKTEFSGEIDTAAEPSAEHSPSSDSPVATRKEKGSSKNISGDEEEEEWAVFETSHSTTTPPVPDSESTSHSQQTTEPEDLVLRTNSVDFDQEAICDDDNFGEFSTTVNDVKAKDIPSKLSSPDTNTPGNQTPDEEESGDDGSGDFSSQPHVHRTIPDEGSKEETDSKLEYKAEHNEETNRGDFEDVSATGTAQTSKKGETAAEEEDDFGDFSSKEATQGDFGDFSAKEISPNTAEEDEFGDFSSRDSKGNHAGNDDIDNDDFGDFSSQPASSAASAAESKTNDFGAFSAKPGSGSDAEDDFGDFSSQASTAPAGDSGWADFSGPSSTKTNTEGSDDFGDFSDTKPAPVPDSTPTSGPHTAVALETKFETALSNCFPGYSTSSPLLSEEEGNENTTAEDESTTETTDVDKFGMLETILKYGLRFRSASLQTWQVVQHPSKKDPRVRLWGHLKDVDGSQAVIYQWGKSHTNALLFNTLHIDTQNMLIGHKKVSVPIFATGLSLLEPIRGGERDRGLGMAGQLSKGVGPPMAPVAQTLVDPNQQYAEQSAQEIPAVDFDWSTSGLTNPLTSKSLDLDFLVVQDNDASEKPSVFESELLDAPRSSVKSTRPLEDILKSVKPTSVNRRRDDAATSQMSAEASRVLAGLPDLSFMHSKVLMFPIRN